MELMEGIKSMSEDTKELDSWQPYAYWMDTIPGVGRITAGKLLEVFQTPPEIYRAGEKALSQVVNVALAKTIKEAQKQEIQKPYEALLKNSIRFVPFYHPAYPKRLQGIPDEPYALYVKGRLPKDNRRSIAIVGARNCSEYGRYVAEVFAKELAYRGIQIVSGLAAGIDGIAQRAALQVSGKTYGVLGCGVDICYPASNRALYDEVTTCGGVLSAYPPGTKPKPALFPPRNRIISGLSDIVLVIEARKKSGTLITVDMALEQGREVYVVPGRITDRLSDGCNSLLRQGAGIALSPGQLIQELEESIWREERQETDFQGEHAEKENKAAFSVPRELPFKNLSHQEKTLLSLLDFYPISLDQIYMMAQTNALLCDLTLPQLMEKLLCFTVAGYVSNEGGCYMLKRPACTEKMSMINS